jgi:transposase-like protein
MVKLSHYRVGKDSIVGIATRNGLDGPRIEFRWMRKMSRHALGPTQPPAYAVGTGFVPRG